MKTILSLLLFIPVLLFSQQSDMEPVDFPDKEANFPGGDEAMKKFLAENLEYPEIAMQLGDQGRVYIEFIVNKDGTLEQVGVLKGVSKELDSESVRVIKTMPLWTPAELDGEKVRARCRIPINFKLTDPEEDDKGDNEQKKQ